MKGDQCIGGFRVVHATEPAADGERLVWKRFFTQEPTRHIHFMNALVSQVPGPVVPKPVPVIMEFRAARRRQRRGAAPEIVINACRHGLRPFCFANAGAPLVTKTPGRQNASQMPVVDPLHRLLDSLAGARLCSGLDNFPIVEGRRDHLFPFPNVVRNRFFDIDIPAALHTPHGGQGVPMIGRGNGNRIDIFALQQFANIGVSGHCCAVLRAPLDPGIEHGAVNVAQGRQAHAGDFAPFFNVVLPAPVESDHRHANVLIGPGHLGPGTRGQTECAGGEGGLFKESCGG